MIMHIDGLMQMHWNNVFLPCSPPGWRGIVVTVWAGGRAVGRSGRRLPDLRNPYLCNRLMDFLRSKFNVLACNCALSCSFAHLPHMGLPMGQKLATNWVQTLRIAYLWNRCIAQIAPLSFQGSHRTQTQTSEVRWLHASVVTEWVTSMFA